MSGKDQKTLIIGAGIVGLTCAYFLNAQGRSMRIIHDTPLDATASCGSAGAIAMAGLLKKAVDDHQTVLHAAKLNRWEIKKFGI